MLLLPANAAADIGGEKNTEQDDRGNVVLTVGVDGSVSQPAAKGGTLDCLLYAFAPSFESPAENPPLSGEQLVEEQYYWLTCTDAAGATVVARLFQYLPGETAITPDELARRARDQLAIRYPEPRTSPGFGVDQIVGIETWMWIDAAAWQPVSATASIPGLSVSATATPRQVTWDMGDGTTVVCDGPGMPYDAGRPIADQSSDCTHVYQRLGARTASATVVWSVEWESSDGGGGTLADASRTTQFPMTVVERQAVGR
ncbi:hypothetical protein [Actinospongicola halichondriae]|uniref:hypothetical protein n=1 Tax=Actinospongicola halichondriae TaxID=3236844 RepID=UPI003D47EDC6